MTRIDRPLLAALTPAANIGPPILCAIAVLAAAGVSLQVITPARARQVRGACAARRPAPRALRARVRERDRQGRRAARGARRCTRPHTQGKARDAVARKVWAAAATRAAALQLGRGPRACAWRKGGLYSASEGVPPAAGGADKSWNQ